MNIVKKLWNIDIKVDLFLEKILQYGIIETS